MKMSIFIFNSNNSHPQDDLDNFGHTQKYDFFYKNNIVSYCWNLMKKYGQISSKIYLFILTFW